MSMVPTGGVASDDAVPDEPVAPTAPAAPRWSTPVETSPPSAELARLLCASAAGDQASFAVFYDRVAGRVFGLVLRVLRDRAQAEEVTQDVFIEVWRQAGRFDPDRGSALAWVLTMAHRRAVDRVRSAEASTRREAHYELREYGTPYDTTVDEAERNLDAEVVRTALDGLSDIQRGAVELAYFHGLTHREVAERLGLPLGTVKTRIRDALIRLRTTMGAET